MNGELLAILEAIERDKGVDREILIQAVEGALATAAKKSLGVGEDADVTVRIDRNTGHLSVVSEAHEVSAFDFSRIAAQTAKQVIIQKIREAEREVVFEEFQGRVGDIVTGTVHRFERGDIIVELGRAEAIVPRAERIPHEEYHQGDRVQGYVLDVRKTVKGPSIVLSRAHDGFIRGLFALEVPEIAEGIVEIKGIAREPGDRTKIAVASRDDKVDCIGACVGMRGTRVKNIVRELHGEKVDIIRWHEGIREFIGAALSPAQISEIQADGTTKRALVIVDDDQLSLAIGKKGQNVRLASKLVGWELEIKSRGQFAAGQTPLHGLAGVGPAMETRLAEAGITTLQQLSAKTVEELRTIKGVGPKTAQKILEAAAKALEAATAAAPRGPAEPGVELPPIAAAAPPPELAPERQAVPQPEGAPETTAEAPAEVPAAPQAGGAAEPPQTPTGAPEEADQEEAPAVGETRPTAKPSEPETSPAAEETDSPGTAQPPDLREPVEPPESPPAPGSSEAAGPGEEPERPERPAPSGDADETDEPKTGSP